MRLTKKTKTNDYYIPVKKGMLMAGYVDKLGQLEDIMEKYAINSLEELEHIILNNATGEDAFRNYVETNVMPYRNIEMELGISLITLFKALTDSIAVKNKDGTIDVMWACPRFQISVDKSDSWILYGPVEEQKYVSIKDYGKTWALTEKELEK